MFTGRHQVVALVVALQVACFMVCAQPTGTSTKKITGGGGYAVENSCNHEYDVDYLDLAITWGPGVCSTNKVSCKPKIDPKFTIHGLWPQRNSHSSPIDCCTKTFYDSGEVKTIKNDLRAHWPALNNLHSSETFWPYEWNKHGSCATKLKGVGTVREYFEFSLKSFKRWNIEQILSKQGFEPDDQNWYSGQEITTTLSRAIGNKVAIDCAPSKKDPRVLILTQVHICFDKKLQLTNCKNTSKKCRNKIRFPKVF